MSLSPAHVVTLFGLSVEAGLVVWVIVAHIRLQRRLQRRREEERLARVSELFGLGGDQHWPDSLICEMAEVSPAELKRMQATSRRAGELLAHVVGREEFELICQRQYYEVPSRLSRGRSYRVMVSGVQILEREQVIGGICIAATGQLAAADRLLTLILMARYQEARMLKVGNVNWDRARLLTLGVTGEETR